MVAASPWVGMALKLATLFAWRVGRFYSPTGHVTVRSTSRATETRLAEAGLTARQNLRMIARIPSLTAVLTSLLMEVKAAEEAEGFA